MSVYLVVMTSSKASRAMGSMGFFLRGREEGGRCKRGRSVGDVRGEGREGDVRGEGSEGDVRGESESKEEE